MVKGRRFSLLAVLIVAILLAAIGIERTASNDQPVVPAPKKTVLVNEQPLETAQRFSRYVGSKEEDEYSREAIRVADRELDLAFNTALRQAQSDPGAAANPQTRDLRAHARDLEEEIKKDQAEVKQMTSALESKGKNADDVQEQLDLTQAELALHQEELDDAKQDLERTGDDTEMKIRRMLSDHEAAEHSDQANTSVAAQRTVAFQVPNTMVAQIALWRQLGKRLFYLAKAQQLALSYSQTLRSEHDQLEQKLKLNVPAGEAKAPIKSIADLKRLAGERESLAEYDKRARAQQQLAQVYGEWSSLVTTQRTACVHGILLFVLSILLIALVLMGIDAVIDHFLLRMAPDRRRRGAMRLVVRFILQVVGVVCALFVLFGRPSQLSTVLGLAGAGLTVALKDFIVGFFGWFVLMGKNGIRVGDWVEIDGIGGEVVEIGLLRTVLLETGNWSDSGHPTGRKVTFINSYAIEGHYFNFSTTGQWLWDTLELTIPVGQAPYAIAEAIMKYVLDETEANTKEAEQEWQNATREYGLQPISAAPTINMRPSMQGINVIVRYITRAHQRYEVRTRIYQGVIDLLHHPEEKAMQAGK